MFRSAIDIHRAELDKFFERKDIAQLSELRRALGVQSRTTLFFALKAVGYFTSYSHAGRYYTLRRIPKFDMHGLWFLDDVRFSKHGTLRASVVVLVCEAPAGRTHEELAQILGLRVHDTLRSLVEAAEIGREQVEAVFVYVDMDPHRASAQLAERRKSHAVTPVATVVTLPLDPSRIIEVLVAIIHHPDYALSRIVAGLQSRGFQISEAQVEQVLATYGVKKTARSRSRRSRRCARRSPRWASTIASRSSTPRELACTSTSAICLAPSAADR